MLRLSCAPFAITLVWAVLLLVQAGLVGADAGQVVLSPEPPAADTIVPPAPGATVKRRRVAVVGAGASGSAAAFFLSRAARVAEDRAGLPPNSLLDLVVFEQEDRVGGRAAVIYPHGDDRLAPHELGASIFVDANRNLVKAAELFNLTLVTPSFGDTGVAIWNGEEVVFETTPAKSRWSDWWDLAAVVRRYGAMSPLRQRRAVASLLERFARLYDHAWLARRGTVASIEEFASSADLGTDLTTRTGADWARNVVKTGALWTDEIIEASTRVNYCADLDGIHALGTAVSLAAGGAKSVLGGNRQIFEGMLKHSGADVRLSTKVTDIVPDGKHRFRVSTNSSSAASDDVFDDVFFASSWHLSPVSKSLSSHFDHPIPKQDYVSLHVTFIATTASQPDPTYFNRGSDASMPGTVLTTGAGVRSGGPEPEFQSLSYHGETRPWSGEWVVKLFSRAELDNNALKRIFGSEPTWVKRHVWHSYPVLHPTAIFPPAEPMAGFHYLAALEPWVSTMETQTLSAREAVARLAQSAWNVGLGECRAAGSWDFTC